MPCFLLQGHVLDILRDWPAEFFNCCVTSPPYWGLRDYKTEPQVWGGESGCQHEWVEETVSGELRTGLGLAKLGEQYRGGGHKQGTLGRVTNTRGSCVKCGAWRGHLGGEPTPEMYVGHLVEIFREVRRVLRADGTLFLNLGDSFFGGKNPIRSRQPSRAPACGNDDTGSADSPEPGFVCLDLCDGCRAVFENRTTHNTYLPSASSPHDRTDRDNERSGSASASFGAAPLGVRESTIFESSRLPLEDCRHCSNCGVCLSVLRSSSCDDSLCARRVSYPGTNGTIPPPRLLDSRIGNDLSSSAYPYCTTSYLKHKDLVGIPWRVAFALQADGWWLRSDIIWAKPNPMPESVTDRPTKSHEYLFLLSKSERYFYNAEAVKEDAAEPIRVRWGERFGGTTGHTVRHSPGSLAEGPREFRNRRSVWTIATHPYKGAHFATFPPELARTCLLAGCPQEGKSCDCDELIFTPLGSGSSDDPTLETGRAGMNRPRRPNEGSRPITRREQQSYAAQMKKSPHRDEMAMAAGAAFAHYIRTDEAGARPLPPNLLEQWLVLRWLVEPEPCRHGCSGTGIVLDPFVGSGTTVMVATQLGMDAVGIDLNPDYILMAEHRVERGK